MNRLALALALLSTLVAGHADARSLNAPNQSRFLIRDGEVWVQAGDSITAQQLYTTYLEAFIRARYPKLKFIAVNSGESGEVTSQAVKRFSRSIAAFRPTLVTSAYGMNDHSKEFPGDQNFYNNPRSGPQRFADEVRKVGARYVIFSASPLIAPAEYATDGGRFQLTGDKSDLKAQPKNWRSNPTNKMFAEKLKTLAASSGILFLDQMSVLQTIWGQNTLRDRVAAFRRALAPFENEPITSRNFSTQALLLFNAASPFLNDIQLRQSWPAPERELLLGQWRSLKRGDVESWESFRRTLRDWVKWVDATNPPFVQISSYDGPSQPLDVVHPNAAGHLHMAGALFKQMNADGLVSSVEIDAKIQKLVKAERATVHDVSLRNGVLSFKRLDESLPLPIDPIARSALDVNVITPIGNPRDLFGISRYLLKVTNLPKGAYEIAIDMEAVATTNADELERGVDLGLLKNGPVFEQTQRVLETVKKNLRVADRKRVNKIGPDFAPYTLRQAQPVEHAWTIRPIGIQVDLNQFGKSNFENN